MSDHRGRNLFEIFEMCDHRGGNKSEIFKISDHRGRIFFEIYLKYLKCPITEEEIYLKCLITGEERFCGKSVNGVQGGKPSSQRRGNF